LPIRLWALDLPRIARGDHSNPEACPVGEVPEPIPLDERQRGDERPAWAEVCKPLGEGRSFPALALPATYGRHATMILPQVVVLTTM
jgi:hypothetical protein